LTENPTCVRAVTLTKRIVIGTRAGEICEIEKNGDIRIRIQGQLKRFDELFSSKRSNLSLGHGEGEMWGLAVNPRRNEICTVSDDKTVRIWSLEERRMIRFRTFDSLLRTCQYSQTGETIAIGTKDGSSEDFVAFSIHFDFFKGKVIIVNETDLKDIYRIEHRNQEVSDIKFSPSTSITMNLSLFFFIDFLL
jgi:WD40 repeat protein